MCRSEKNATSTPDAVVACNERLISELKEQRITKVLACGATALSALVPSFTKGITKARGTWFWHDDLGCYVLPTFHPAALLRNPDYFPDFIQDLAAISQLPKTKVEMPRVEYKVVETSRDMTDMIETIEALDSTHISLDLETTGLSEFTNRILCIGIAADEDHIYIIPDTVFEYRWAKRDLKLLLENETLCWTGQNAYQFDAKFLRQKFDIDVDFKFDTMLAHYTLDERQSGHSLKDMARIYFQAPDYAAGLPKGDFESIDRDILYQYLAYDCYYTWKLVPVLDTAMSKEGVSHVHDSILLPGADALGQMEHSGCLIDAEYLQTYGEELDDEIADALAEVRRVADEPEFNPNSPKQVKELLLGKLELKTLNGGTDKEALENLDHPVGNAILDLRLKTKLKSTYVKGLLDSRGPDGRIHGDFNIFGTVTGRLSSSHPNLQNIPTLAGPMIRNAFIPQSGWTIVEADYSQLEFRVGAYFSHDPRLIDIFLTGADLHRQVASQVFHVSEDEVTHYQRYVAKYVDFGIFYGRGAASLAYGELKCSVAEAQKYIDEFLGQFSSLFDWMKKMRKQAVTKGYVETAFGRKRRFPLILPNNKGDIERQAVNSPIQGTASDICLGALTRLQNRLDPETARALLTVHDSISFEVKDENLETTLPIIFQEMEDHVPLDSPVPFRIDVKTGERWGSLEEVNREDVLRNVA
jgi:DNA polymerase-1